MIPVSELVKDKQYRISSNGTCKEMETTIYRTFYGVNNNGQALFNDDSMGCPVIYNTSIWTFNTM